MHVIMLFLDGVGIGTSDPRRNPFFIASLPNLRALLGGVLPTLRRRTIDAPGASIIPIDANLGVAGLPQSGTGQVTLFTGVNAPRIIGRHFGPHPYSTIRPLLNERNIFRRLLDANKTACFANSFPRRFFEFAEQRRSRLTATTSSCLASGIPLRGEQELIAGDAVSADITGEAWPSLGHALVAPLSPEAAGERLAALGRRYDFVLFEYWKTDHAGHSLQMQEAIDVLELFDRFLGGLLRASDLHSTLIVATSDHGNIEDISIKTHTRHPVPLLAVGDGAREFLERVKRSARRPDLTAVTPAILATLKA